MPYVVYGNPTIRQGASASLAAGAVVKADRYETFNVQGALELQGTAGNESAQTVTVVRQAGYQVYVPLVIR